MVKNIWEAVAQGKGSPAQPLPHCRCKCPCPSLWTPSALVGPICASAYTQVNTQDQVQKRLCCQWLHNCFHPPWGEEQVWRCPCPELIACLGTSPSWRPHVPTANIRRAVCEEPLAEVPGCKGFGLIKLPLIRHYRELRPGRYFCAFLYVCVFFLSPILDYQRKESRWGYRN